MVGLAVGELIELGHLDVEVGAGTRDKRAIGSVPHRREPYSNRQGNRVGEAKGGIKEGCGFEQWHDIEPLQQCTGRGAGGGRKEEDGVSGFTSMAASSPSARELPKGPGTGPLPFLFLTNTSLRPRYLPSEGAIATTFTLLFHPSHL